MSSAKKKSAKGGSGAREPNGEFFDHGVEVARALAAIVENHGVAELVYETDDLNLTIRRGALAAAAAHPMMPAMQPMAPMQVAPPPQVVQAAPAAAPEPPAAAAPATDKLHEVTSPFVGTFYRAPNPDAPSYVEVGQRVEKGQVICIVEAMKLMNEIEADVSGTITAVLVQNAEPVEYGQPLFKIDTA